MLPNRNHTRFERAEPRSERDRGDLYTYSINLKAFGGWVLVRLSEQHDGTGDAVGNLCKMLFAKRVTVTRCHAGWLSLWRIGGIDLCQFVSLFV